MKKTLSLSLFYVFFGLCCFAQSKFQGFVFDGSQNAPLANASVKWGDRTVETLANGSFSFKQKGDSALITVSKMGYAPSKSVISKKGDTVFLYPKFLELKEHIVFHHKSSTINAAKENYQLLGKKDILSQPSFLGNADVLHALKILPGIGKGGEGNAGIYVRGGGSGQNMVLFNQAVVYNPLHLLGLFSVFNTAFVSKAKIYKSGVPAKFEGRSSAIIDIGSEQDVCDSMRGSATVSGLFADVEVNIPVDQRFSVHLGGRKTFMNLLVWPLLNTRKSKNELSYDFYDLNFNAVAQFAGSKLLLSAYTGSDDFGMLIKQGDIKNKMDWQNTIGSALWEVQLAKHLSFTSSLSHSRYNFGFSIGQESSNANIRSHVADIRATQQLAFVGAAHSVKVGVDFAASKFLPNDPQIAVNGNQWTLARAQRYYAVQGALYIMDDFHVTPSLTLSGGLRTSIYRSWQDVAEDGFAAIFLEPSLRVSLAVNPKFLLRAGMSSTTQTTRLLPVTSSSFPTDFWMPSTAKILPEKAWQFNMGAFRQLPGVSLSAELFYKRFDNAIEFNGGMGSLIDDLSIKNQVLLGKGMAYGAEFQIKKEGKRWDANISYTIAKSKRKFDAIAHGAYFPFRFDRPNDINLSGAYKLGAKWQIGALFTYADGNPYTATVSRYVVSGSIVNEYGRYNGSRMPAYHRLDFSASVRLAQSRHIDGLLTLSVYNVYNRANPISSYYSYSGNLGNAVITEQKQLALLPILPAITYKINFR